MKKVIRLNFIMNENFKNFREERITKSLYDKYRPIYPNLRHIRVDNNSEGVFLSNKGEFVAVLNCDLENGFITALEVSPKYRGSGIASYLLDKASNSFGVHNLTVNKKNEEAIKLYKKKGYKVFKETSAMYYMTNGKVKTISEETLTKKERDRLPDEKFGIPSERSFPLHDRTHVVSAIRYFKYCPKLKRKELANNIQREAKKYGITIDEKSLVSKYITETVNEDTKVKVREILEENAVFESLLNLNEAFTIDPDGTMLISLREKSNFMSKYNTSHRLLKIYMKAGNTEGAKHELAKLYYMYVIIESYYVHKQTKPFLKINYEGNKKEALKAKAFILNDFTNGLKWLLKKEPDFNFDEYFQDTPYNKDVLKFTTETVKGIKKFIMALI